MEAWSLCCSTVTTLSYNNAPIGLGEIKKKKFQEKTALLYIYISFQEHIRHTTMTPVYSSGTQYKKVDLSMEFNQTSPDLCGFASCYTFSRIILTKWILNCAIFISHCNGMSYIYSSTRYLKTWLIPSINTE